MKKSSIVTALVLALALCLCGCSGAFIQPATTEVLDRLLGPAAQDWVCVQTQIGSFRMESKGLSAAESQALLEQEGVFSLDNPEGYTWTENADGSVTMVLNGLRYSVGEGLTLRFEGLVLTLEPAAAIPEVPTVDPAALFEGTWYGYFQVNQGFGDWTELTEYVSTAWAVFESDSDGNWYLYIYLDDDDSPSLGGRVLLTGNALELEEGYFWDYEISGSEDWQVSVDLYNSDLLCISSTYIDPELTEDDGFTYTLCFRPMGLLWPDGSDLPPSYAQYAAQVAAGFIEAREPMLGSAAMEPGL